MTGGKMQVSPIKNPLSVREGDYGKQQSFNAPIVRKTDEGVKIVQKLKPVSKNNSVMCRGSIYPMVFSMTQTKYPYGTNLIKNAYSSIEKLCSAAINKAKACSISRRIINCYLEFCQVHFVGVLLIFINEFLKENVYLNFLPEFSDSLLTK